jgi:CheY-like chemotaxis protein
VGRAAARLFAADGYDVALVARGRAGLAAAAEARPDVVLLDIDLGGRSGFDVAERLRSDGRPAPPRIILISTHVEQDYADLIAASPAIGFVAKTDLSAGAIRNLLDAGGPGTTAPVSGPRGR